MISPKRNKSLKFNKVEKHNFKNAKRLSINKSINDSNNNLIYIHNSNNKKEKRRSQVSSALNIVKNIDENYSLTKNRSPIKTMKKMNSSNKIQMIMFKDLLLKHKSFLKKEEQKNETDNQLPIILKLDQKNIDVKKKFISSNNISHILKSYNKNIIKNNSRKSKNKNNNNELQNENTNYDINNVVKVKKKKRESKEMSDNKEIFEYKHNKSKKDHKEKKEHKNKKENNEHKSKNEIKEDKKNNENLENENEKEKSLKNNVKCKFFCCL